MSSPQNVWKTVASQPKAAAVDGRISDGSAISSVPFVDTITIDVPSPPASALRSATSSRRSSTAAASSTTDGSSDASIGSTVSGLAPGIEEDACLLQL